MDLKFVILVVFCFMNRTNSTPPKWLIFKSLDISAGMSLKDYCNRRQRTRDRGLSRSAPARRR